MDADHYFPMRHLEALAAAAPRASVWVEAGMGHAELATGAELVRRIAEWLRSALPASDLGTTGPHRAVCDDGARD